MNFIILFDPVPTLNKTGSPGIESLPGISAITVNEQFWQQEGVSQEKLSQWNKNLRQVWFEIKKKKIKN